MAAIGNNHHQIGNSSIKLSCFHKKLMN